MSGPGPILPGHPLFGLVESRQDAAGTWHYFKNGTNQEIVPAGSGLEWLLDNAEAFLPTKVVGVR